MGQPGSVPEELREGMRNLTRSFQRLDEDRSFDRCSIDSSCQNPSIKAHALPRSVLELIADQEGMVVGSPDDLPQNPIAWEKQGMLTKRSIGTFGVGRWACAEHDSIFSPIDRKAIDFEDKRNLFLAVYRLTLRLNQLSLRLGERLALTSLDSQNPLVGVPEPNLEVLKQIARQATFVAQELFVLTTRMSNFWRQETFDKIEYRVAEWDSAPTLAASGMKWLDGPGDGVYWDEQNWVSENSSIPAWLIVLPQRHGQTVVTASLKDFESHTAAFHQGMPRFGEPRGKSGANWGRLISRKVLECAVDLAISPERYHRMTASEQTALQDYMRRRSQYQGKRVKLPNLLK